jgi:hypothetical protein
MEPESSSPLSQEPSTLLHFEPHKCHNIYSVAFSPQAIYTHWATATCWRNLVSTFADRVLSRDQRCGSPTVVNLSFLDRSRYFCHIIYTIRKQHNPTAAFRAMDFKIAVKQLRKHYLPDDKTYYVETYCRNVTCKRLSTSTRRIDAVKTAHGSASTFLLVALNNYLNISKVSEYSNAVQRCTSKVIPIRGRRGLYGCEMVRIPTLWRQ